MRTANPVLRADTFDHPATTGSDRMTVAGAVNKTALLVLAVFGSAVWAWRTCASGGSAAVYPWLIGALIGGGVLSFVTVIKKELAFATAIPYALCEGVFLGAVSALFERSFPGIAMQAIGLTATTLLALLFAYRAGLVRATEKFRSGVMAATGGICLLYFVSFVLQLFGIQMPFLHDHGIVGIGISMVIVVVAALNLVLDFDFIEQGQARGAAKSLEWYAAFGLLVTLVWLYIEVLRLLAKLQDRR